MWSSKDAAAGWALARTEDPALVQTALAIRHGDHSQTLDPAQVDRFIHAVQARVQRAAGQQPALAGPPAAAPPSTSGTDLEEALAGGDMTVVVRVGDNMLVWGLARYGTPRPVARAIAAFGRAIREGYFDVIDPTFESLSGRPPLSLRDVLISHRGDLLDAA